MTPFKMYLMLSVGVLLAVGCAVLAGTFSKIFNAVLNQMMILKPGSKTLSAFEKPPIPIYFDYYFFHVTNPDEIRFYGKKPIVTEIGPYRYRQDYLRENLTFDDANGTVEYIERSYYIFDRNQSVGAEDDRVTLLNPLLTIAAWKIYQNQTISSIIWPELESSMPLFQELKIGELLFSGYDLPIFNFDFSFIPGLEWTKGLNGSAYEILKKLGMNPPDLLKENKFGLYYGKNGTISGTYTVETGAKNIDEYLNIRTLDNDTHIPFWKTTYCNMLNGTDGTQFPPQKKKISKNLRLFNVDLCRSLYVEFERTANLHDILETRRYSIPKELLQSPKRNPDNACFCIPLPGESRCLNDSMINAAPCKLGMPIILSTPHFYMGDQYDIDNVIGINPNKSLHETFLQLEPISGVVVDAAKRIQVNLPMKSFSTLPAFANVRELIFPLLWACQSAKFTEEDAKTLNSVLTQPYTIGYSILGVLIFVGVLIASVAVYKLRTQKISKLLVK